ncbi:MAG: hypothetical protein LUE24_07925 [Lachnospiraceae bacterium]|nr:hypothetical protein [Lachnospiraceae bacterium]
MHLTEGRNTGFLKILNALERNGSPKPVFETEPERLSFCTTLLIHPAFLNQSEGINEELTEKEQMALNFIISNPSVSVARMVKELTLPRTSVERTIRKLKQNGFIIHDGPKKNGRWVVLR